VRADNQFRQRAAIKLVKRGMDTDFVIRRFRNERQILAAVLRQNSFTFSFKNFGNEM